VRNTLFIGRGYKNSVGRLTDDLGGQQFHWCLSVTVRKLVNKIRVGGGFWIVDSDDGDMEIKEAATSLNKC
jgi:hypothetical protein